MTMITPSYLGETIEYSSLHACRSTLEDPTRNDERLLDVVGVRSVSSQRGGLDSGIVSVRGLKAPS